MRRTPTPPRVRHERVARSQPARQKKNSPDHGRDCVFLLLTSFLLQGLPQLIDIPHHLCHRGIAIGMVFDGELPVELDRALARGRTRLSRTVRDAGSRRGELVLKPRQPLMQMRDLPSPARNLMYQVHRT
jgi:hypothetical protein